MNARARLGWALGALLLLGSCTTNRMLAVPHPDDAAPQDPWKQRQAVSGYTTIDGVFHELPGYVESTGDSLRFVMPPHHARGLERDRPGFTATVPRDSVRDVSVALTDVPRSVLAGVGIAAIAATFVLVGMAASFSNEPLL